ncbi:unnamed protein product [Rhizophagus irregularis]|nr:unnamed protein product [Rhizophagus irregularis]
MTRLGLGSSSFTTLRPNSSSRQQSTRPLNKDDVKDVNQQKSKSNSGSTPLSSSQNTSSIPPDVIKEIRNQILEISQQLSALDERVESLEYSISDHNYRIGELEAMMNYDDPSRPNDETSYQPESCTQQDGGWDTQYHADTYDSSSSPSHHATNPSIMDESPDPHFLP